MITLSLVLVTTLKYDSNVLLQLQDLDFFKTYLYQDAKMS